MLRTFLLDIEKSMRKSVIFLEKSCTNIID